MPDFSKLVHDHLAQMALEPGERAEVLEELAAHSEEMFRDLRRQGLSEDDATRGCLLEVEDWRGLGLRIEAARKRENIMSNRVTQFWAPGLVTFALSMGLLALAEIYGPKPWILRSGNPPVMVVHIPWLLGLPVVGVLGAFLSRRAGGSRRAILSSIVFPVLPFLTAILLITPVILAFDHLIAHNPEPASIAMALVGLVLVPGVALLAGGLPAQLFFSRRLDSRRIASD
jgi:hypothetical protein